MGGGYACRARASRGGRFESDPRVALTDRSTARAAVRLDAPARAPYRDRCRPGLAGDRAREALSMRARARVLLLLLLLLSLMGFPSVALGAALPTVAPLQMPTIVTMRLGISAGDAIQSVNRATDRRALERIIPELFQTATALGIRIDEV